MGEVDFDRPDEGRELYRAGIFVDSAGHLTRGGIVLMVTVFLVIVASVTFVFWGMSRGHKVTIEFTPGDSYCADLPRLAAAYEAKREEARREGREQAFLAAALDDLTALSEACAAESKQAAAAGARDKDTIRGLEEYVVRDRMLCCGDDDGVVFVGCSYPDNK